MPASPNVLNYAIGKGNVFMKIEGGEWRHIGNCPEFEFTPEIEELEHNSSMEGVRVVDRTEVLAKRGTLRVVMEEITPENLAIAVLGELDPETTAGGVIEIFSENAVRRAVRFVGNNSVGSQYTWEFPAVDFIPSSGIPVISEEWMQVEISGKVAVVNGSFGTITETADEATS
jgi:hypothetical protein